MARPVTRTGPLAGVRLLELGGIGPAPFCGMMFADLGADVIRFDRPGTGIRHPVLHRGKRCVDIDLKDAAMVTAVLDLAASSDAAIEGFRPGATERLGLGPADLQVRNPRLVYGRMTGWGQSGPLSQAPGHDINYLALSGALHAIGTADSGPVPPLNLIADFGGGGMMLALGVLAAVFEARATGKGQVIDAAMVDGVAALMATTYGLFGAGQWRDERAANLLDGGRPYYRTYQCADGRHVAVGCIEPQFFAALLSVLGLSADLTFAIQDDADAWPLMAERLAEIFASRTRDEWATAFAGTQACVTPILSLAEAPNHPHNVARGTFQASSDGSFQPTPAPRLSEHPRTEPRPGQHTDDLLGQWPAQP